jgi:hypothetical protein
VKHHTPPPDLDSPTKLPTQATIATEELDRLHRIESAALAVVSSMYRRNGKVSSPSLQTFDKLVALGECFEEEEVTSGNGG